MSFDSEKFYERLYMFALACNKLSNKVPKLSRNNIYMDQLVRSSASIGANYIEALNGLSKKDFVHRLRISRKETRESVHWLRLLKDTNMQGADLKDDINSLVSEAEQFKKIFTSAILTTEQNIIKKEQKIDN
jgi:four helix bundle protein